MAGLTIDQGNEYAEALVHELFPHIGEEDALAEICLRWANTIGPTEFGLTCMAAIRLIFVEYFTNITTTIPKENR